MDAFRNPQTPFVRPVTASAPKAGSPGWKAFTEQRWANNHPNAGQGPSTPKAAGATPTSTAMDAFRTALGQLNAATPQVDSAAIYAPYRASEAITGQLGAGYQTAEQSAGAAAQQQYAQGRDLAQQHAAQFGISAGAGANPTALTDNGTQALAQQTAAYQAAAPAATAQWQALLERTAGAKVGAAELQREQGLTAAKQSLSASLPQAIRDEETLANQKSASQANNAYLRSSLSQKGQQEYDANVLKQEGINAGITKTKLTQSGANSRSAASIAAANSRSANSIAAANQRQSKALQAKSRTATAAGLKGIASITSAITKTTTTKGAKPVVGYTVSFASDPNGVNAGAPAFTKTVKSIADAKPPTGYLPLGPNDTGKPIYGQAGAGTTSGGLSASQWDTYMRSLLAQNRGVPNASAAIKAFLGPRPKK